MQVQAVGVETLIAYLNCTGLVDGVYAHKSSAEKLDGRFQIPFHLKSVCVQVERLQELGPS